MFFHANLLQEFQRVGRATLPDIGPLKTRLRLMKRPVSGRVKGVHPYGAKRRKLF
jgi:hypothetical protein